jgi:VanZ family protein
MFNFMGLGLVAYNAQRFNSKRTLNQAVIYAFFMAVGFACIDETFQTFVPGRSGQIKDVFIDGLGTTIGLVGLWCGSKFIKHKH